MEIPQGIMEWTIFVTGLVIVAYRVHGIDAPRAWVEWLERQFIHAVNLRFIGGILLAAALALGYLGGTAQTLMGTIFMLCIALLAIIGLGLLLLQNHLRHIIFATAESSDSMIRWSSVAIVLVGLALMAAPFYL
jgi:hypothetical protein